MKIGMSWLDIRLGLRMMVKYPALTIVGGLGLAVAIAISVGFFAFARAHIYPELPLHEGDRIVALENRDIETNNEDRQALHDFLLWRGALRTVENLGAFRTVTHNVFLGGPPEPTPVAEMTAAGFRVARVPPLLGRWLLDDDERLGAPPVLVIGYDIWRSRFAGDSAIIGRQVRVGGVLHTVVGVMPEGFGFPESHRLWIPLRVDPTAYERREGPAIYIFGRLAPGVTLEEAQAELTVIGQRTAAEFPRTNATLRPMVMPYVHSLTDVQGITAWQVVQMQLMVSLLLVVIALNVAVLIYARTAMRRGEIAVRTALGASRSRVVAQLFAEALVLSLVAGAVGLALSQVGFRIGNAIMEQELAVPFWADYGLKPATVLFTVGAVVFAAVIVGVLPALQATGRGLQNSLRQLGGSTGMRLGRTWTTLIVAQVAIAVAALPAAVNMGWREIRHATTRPTFASAEYAEAVVQPQVAIAGASTAVADSVPFGDRMTAILQPLEGEPAVAAVSYRAALSGWTGRVDVEGVPAPPESPSGHIVMPRGVGSGYFDLYDSRILAGRDFVPADFGGRATAVIVNRTFVTRVLAGGDALGRRLRPVPDQPHDASAQQAEAPWYQIVGVVEDMYANPMAPELVRAEVYYPIAPAELQFAIIEMRLRGGDLAGPSRRLREIAASVDPSLRLTSIRALAERERQDQLAVRLVALVIGLILVSVVLLSAGGIHALTSFTVTRRRREIGIRSALGAHPWQVLRSIFAQVARQLALGLLLGVGGAVLIDWISGGALFGGRAGILLPVFGVLMAIVAALAAFGPARRGLKVAPTEALRADA